jgi:hypothetical protein
VYIRVELVMISGDGKQRSFALKQMKKSQIVETRQQQHIMSEKVPYIYNPNLDQLLNFKKYILLLLTLFLKKNLGFSTECFWKTLKG